MGRCDELGIMILHDFMLSWYPNIPYPAYPVYRERIQAEVKQKLTDLARHPAIVLWFGMSTVHNGQPESFDYVHARHSTTTHANCCLEAPLTFG